MEEEATEATAAWQVLNDDVASRGYRNDRGHAHCAIHDSVFEVCCKVGERFVSEGRLWVQVVCAIERACAREYQC